MDERPSLKKLKGEVQKFLLLVDTGAIDISLATVIGNKLDLDPVWTMIVAGSSSGKTELLMPFFDLPYMIPISDLTVNTFASGFNMGGGQQASLLTRYKSGILVFKDFTSLLSKNKDAREQIMGQMREIFEGTFNKHTGTGQEIAWKGKMGCIAATTEAIYVELATSTQMGQRFIYYHMKSPPRREAALRAFQNAHKSIEMRHALKAVYKEYLDMVIDKIHAGDVNYDLPGDFAEDFIDLADFSSLARSPVHTDFKSGAVDAKPDKEMPGRMMKQMTTLGSAFIVMNQCEAEDGIQLKHELITKKQRMLIKRTGYDSIPSMRRHVLSILAKYRGGVNTAGVAVLLNLPTDSVKKYLYQINALELCDRRIEGGNKGHKWTMKDEGHRKIIAEMEGITPVEGEYIAHGEDIEDELIDPEQALSPEMQEHNDAMIAEFEKAPELPDNF